LPSTSELEATVAARITELKVIQAKPAAQVMVMDDERRAREAVKWAQTQLSDGLYRDTLQAERPEGCWCLGEGGRSRRYLSPEVHSFEEYCGCPDGLAAKERAHQEGARLARERNERELARLFVGAQVPSRFIRATFATYPVSESTAQVVADLHRWVCGPEDAGEFSEWLDRRKPSIFLYGSFGTGKTGLAVSLLHEYVEIRTEAALFLTVPNLLDRIRETYGPHAVATERELIEQVKTVPLLVLDDLGAERVTDWVAEKLFTIINHRHDEDLETVFTSNLSLEELAGHIGERTTWRIVEMCEVLKIDGPNLRDRK